MARCKKIIQDALGIESDDMAIDLFAFHSLAFNTEHKHAVGAFFEDLALHRSLDRHYVVGSSSPAFAAN